MSVSRLDYKTAIGFMVGAGAIYVFWSIVHLVLYNIFDTQFFFMYWIFMFLFLFFIHFGWWSK